MRYGLHVPNFGAFFSPRELADLAVAAETAGWDGLFVWDHIVRKEGDFDVADPWVALAAVATVTTRLLLGPMVTPLPRRRPWNVAKAAITLDHLSGGRMVLGIGAGTPRGPEFAPEAFGEEPDMRRRGDLLDEGLDIIRQAWTGGTVHHRGERYRVDGVRFLPRPVHPDGIPLWAATESLRGRAVRRAASLDGVFPIGIAPDEVPTLLDAVAGYRPSGVADFDVVVVGDDDEPDRWAGSGVTWWLRLLPYDQPLAAARRIVDAGPGSGDQ